MNPIENAIKVERLERTALQVGASLPRSTPPSSTLDRTEQGILKTEKGREECLLATPEGRAEREARWAEIKKMYKHENETFLFRLGLRRHARAAQSANHIRRA